MGKWAVAGAKNVLEPSAGDGVFLQVISELDQPPVNITAIELDPNEAEKAKIQLHNVEGRVLNQDYLDYEPANPVDAVVGNPPFIRYQYLSESTQLKAQNLYKTLGLQFTKHTNAWVPFVIKALMELEPGGRLAMVIPAELLSVLHAGAAREYLLKTCESILVLDADELFFEGTLQRTVLLAAVRRRAGFQGKSKIAFEKISTDTIRNSSIDTIFHSARFVEREAGSAKWMDGLLTDTEREALFSLSGNTNIRLFSDVATVQVGIVTGANSFFVISKSIADKYNLHEYTRPMFGRSSHVRGLTYTSADHEANLKADLPCLFLDLNATDWTDLSPGAKEYLQLGESLDLHLRYKTRIRNPWWHVPSVYRTNISLLKRSNEAPRLIANDIQALTTDTAYRISSTIDSRLLTSTWLNSLTLLACELNGRTYGGGVLELVPSEIRNTPIPVISNLGSFEKLDESLRKGASISELLPQQNKLIAMTLGIGLEELSALENARQRMLTRRTRKAN
ncbi:Eco57I restriction-modification methylase domain-containing protein [Rothia nasimurium]|uniref:Eco57I restriction-modification methylase domain-containing protein n=1 Tax=Rothia nasimurium TaxID=85336 RepID=UPI001FD7557A|nr:N-6 DNA methylase [Rothia nasimurium]